MQIHQKTNGKWVAATYLPTKKRYRTTLTKTFNPSEASSLDDLGDAREYGSLESIARSLRKHKGKL